ncbi:GMP synthase [Mesotoga sp. HF07.pep.5.2.highcov]|uniref:glutamine-hydrolyzing GMP synthase n=1 Tax=Mesotoga sp. HF07.pep.5.2.highcov TaxID=1462923 RepID=UPI000EF1472F|nr:glutamine-hydrolyzing GMP synthase [Mesotoga sp. HF07.pep.5.2.highcov]RLL91126.1 GMP synthase [Mesotoga sp. HF07.pep.5.2.highcov]
MDRIAVIDYGSQYTLLLARRIREMGVFCTVASPEEFKVESEIKGVVLSGGPQSVYEEGALGFPKQLEGFPVPIMGICYGMHLLAKKLGGEVRSGALGEYGLTTVSMDSERFRDIPEEIVTWMSHGDEVTSLPSECKVIARSKNGITAGFSNGRDIAFQFHPEVNHTQFGTNLIEDFVFNVCNASRNWKLSAFAERKVEEIKRAVGNSKVVGGLSGGVDSTVAAVLASKAVGDAFTGIFVNHGLMRKNEDIEVCEALRSLGIKLINVDASEEFFRELKGIDNPEEKRKIIGKTFIKVFEREANRLNASFLLQGTIYSDVIESGAASKNSAKIKSHHNVGGLPDKMNLKLLEPIRELFKDEVRNLGYSLGIEPSLLTRQPFPGPGLGVRIIGEVDSEKARILKEVDSIFMDVLRKSGESEKIWQSFAVLLPVFSVGVKGDKRSYGYVVALRAVNSSEGMTASWHELPYEILREASSRITSGVREVGRVVFDITDKPPATIEWE